MSSNSSLSTLRAVFSPPALDITVPSVCLHPRPLRDPFSHISTCQGVFSSDCPGGAAVRTAEVSFSDRCRRVKAACPLLSRLQLFICDSKAIQSRLSHINHRRDEASVCLKCLTVFKSPELQVKKKSYTQSVWILV